FSYSSAAAFTNPAVTPTLDYRVLPPNQQMRIDILDPSASLLDTGAGVLRTIFQTTSLTAVSQYYTLVTSHLDPFIRRGPPLLLRINGVNNRGKLILGIDNVRVTAIYHDGTPPELSGLHLRNPTFGNAANFDGFTTDPTIVGQVIDDKLAPTIGTPNN